MSNEQLELQKKENLRLSNEESNRITRECLQTALVYLLNEKNLEEITITELVKRSGVSRTAFYRNYNTKEDILEEIKQDLYNNIRDSLNNSFYIQNPRQWLVDYFRIAEEKAALLAPLMKSNLPSLFPLRQSVLATLFPPSDKLTHYMLVALEGALSSVFRHWFLSGRVESPEEMADICIQILAAEPSI